MKWKFLITFQVDRYILFCYILFCSILSRSILFYSLGFYSVPFYSILSITPKKININISSLSRLIWNENITPFVSIEKDINFPIGEHERPHREKGIKGEGKRDGVKKKEGEYFVRKKNISQMQMEINEHCQKTWKCSITFCSSRDAYLAWEC